MKFLSTLLREPLTHFLILGTVLFLSFDGKGGAASGSRQITISALQIDHLRAGFTQIWRRPPSDAELQVLMEDYIREEIAVREALAAGLDRDDSLIRRRLRQNFELLAADVESQAPPSDQELQAWLAARPELASGEPQIAFRQVFVNESRRGASAEQEARRLLALLQAEGSEASLDRLGDASLLPSEQRLTPLAEIQRLFGEDFATQLSRTEPGQWAGPLRSSFGLHLVLVQRQEPGSPSSFPELRSRLERELLAERRAQKLEKLYAGLREKYSITIASRVLTSNAGGGR